MKKLVSLCTAAVLCLSLLSACGPKASQEDSPSIAPGKAADLAAFAQTVQESHEFPSFMERMDPENADMGDAMKDMLANYYSGLTDLDLEQMEVYMSMASFSSGELALAQAKSAEDAAKVKEIFQARIDAKSTEGPGNYPEEVEIWQRSAQVASANDTYVMLVCHDDADAIVSEFEALFQ